MMSEAKLLRASLRRRRQTSVWTKRVHSLQYATFFTSALVPDGYPTNTCPKCDASGRLPDEAGKPPWIESRLQDFFGMETGPVIAGGRAQLVMHLLAPNHRPVQVTTDLAGFWRRVYPQVRKELSRRYPRHAWPEDPLR